ncbi:MAG: mechanosensitive ion channel family protein [Nitrospinae bacterium]|nr:mechanosensitive ion channel family protein [Nitrospinota bacterium]
MEIVLEFFSGISWETIIRTSLRVLVILIIAWILLQILKRFLKGVEKQLVEKSVEEGEPPTESQKRIETIVRLSRQGVKLIIWITVLLVILKELGFEIAPVIASAGIAGLAVGFGAQNLVRDIISGFFIILENQIRVGDVAILNGTGGLVEKINFRTTVLRDLGGIVHIFPNGTITTISNLTNEWSAYIFDIGVAYKENTDKVIEIMQEVGKEMVQDEKFSKIMLEEPEVFGVDKFADSAVIIKGRIRTKPIRQWEVGREYLRRIKHAFDTNNIEIPFPHRSIYFGEASKPVNFELIENLKRKKSS